MQMKQSKNIISPLWRTLTTQHSGKYYIYSSHGLMNLFIYSLIQLCVVCDSDVTQFLFRSSLFLLNLHDVMKGDSHLPSSILNSNLQCWFYSKRNWCFPLVIVLTCCHRGVLSLLGIKQQQTRYTLCKICVNAICGFYEFTFMELKSANIQPTPLLKSFCS